MAQDMSSSRDGDLVMVGMMAEASMESVVLGMAVTTMTVFAAVAHAPLAMMVMAGAMTGSYGLRASAMVAIGVASVVSGDRAISTSQPATCRLARAMTLLGRSA
jgi:H+/Cl- antiporter ClcA